MHRVVGGGGGRWEEEEEAGLCINARSEPRKKQMRPARRGKETVLLRSHHTTKRKCHNSNRAITHLLTLHVSPAAAFRPIP